MLPLFVKLLLFKLNKASSKCCICFSSIESANLECKFPLHETNGHSLMNIFHVRRSVTNPALILFAYLS